MAVNRFHTKFCVASLLIFASCTGGSSIEVSDSSVGSSTSQPSTSSSTTATSSVSSESPDPQEIEPQSDSVEPESDSQDWEVFFASFAASIVSLDEIAVVENSHSEGTSYSATGDETKTVVTADAASAPIITTAAFRHPGESVKVEIPNLGEVVVSSEISTDKANDQMVDISKGLAALGEEVKSFNITVAQGEKQDFYMSYHFKKFDGEYKMFSIGERV